ncbi:hypothetical protein SAMN06298216_4335 [Spirosomataceae bacterium TFI 002]|nr:hypothetical protein SAMN06298216_4335 [Spirosomataceae bacterium TFI 002]
MPQICTSIAASMGDVLVMEQSTYGGYKLEQHVLRNETISKLKGGMPDYNKSKTRRAWDYVVLQDYSQFPSASEEHIQKHTIAAVKSLDSLNRISNPNSKLLFYQTWGRKNGDKSRCEEIPEVCTYAGMDNLTAITYDRLAAEFNGIVSPVGSVWHYLRDHNPDIELYNIDESHPSEAGSYAAACTFYAVVYQRDPRGIPFNYLLDFDTAYKIKNGVYRILSENGFVLN